MSSFLEHWLEGVLSTPGLTGLTDRAAARRVLLEDALRAADLLGEWAGTVVDVGSGGGSPGIPLATALANRPFVLLEAERRKCAFLEEITRPLDNVTVVWGRAEEQPTDAFGAAVAKALAKPPVAAELCLPLVAPGGAAILWLAEDADLGPVSTVAARLGAELEETRDGLVVLRKLHPTPDGFPRRTGMARKRPLA